MICFFVNICVLRAFIVWKLGRLWFSSHRWFCQLQKVFFWVEFIELMVCCSLCCLFGVPRTKSGAPYSVGTRPSMIQQPSVVLSVAKIFFWMELMCGVHQQRMKLFIVSELGLQWSRSNWWSHQLQKVFFIHTCVSFVFSQWCRVSGSQVVKLSSWQGATHFPE